MKFLVVPLLCLAFLAAASAESEPELDAAQLTDEALDDDLLQELKPLENEYEAVSRADKEDPGKDEETEIINILDKELGPLMRDDLDAEEERNPALKPKDRFRRRWRRRWRRFSRRVRRSVRRVHRRVRKSVRRARRSVSRRYKRLRNSIRKRLRRIRGFFGGIQNAIRRVRSGMRRVNYTWKMIKSIRTFIRNYPGAPNRR